MDNNEYQHNRNSRHLSTQDTLLHERIISNKLVVFWLRMSLMRSYNSDTDFWVLKCTSESTRTQKWLSPYQFSGSENYDLWIQRRNLSGCIWLKFVLLIVRSDVLTAVWTYNGILRDLNIFPFQSDILSTVQQTHLTSVSRCELCSTVKSSRCCVFKIRIRSQKLMLL
jgi:hypothetical protein